MQIATIVLSITGETSSPAKQGQLRSNGNHKTGTLSRTLFSITLAVLNIFSLEMREKYLQVKAMQQATISIGISKPSSVQARVAPSYRSQSSVP